MLLKFIQNQKKKKYQIKKRIRMGKIMIFELKIGKNSFRHKIDETSKTYPKNNVKWCGNEKVVFVFN